MAGGSADFTDQHTWPFLVPDAREQAERYLARLSTSTMPAGWAGHDVSMARVHRTIGIGSGQLPDALPKSILGARR